MTVTLHAHQHRIDYLVGAERFASYLPSAPMPGFSALFAPEYRPMTLPDSATGLSVWFEHSDINGTAFTADTTSVVEQPRGQIVTTDFIVRRASYSVGFQHMCDWIATNRKKVLTDVRTARVSHGPGEGRILDLRIDLKATASAPVVFGSCDHALLCLRLAGAFTAAHSQIRNSEGQFGLEGIDGQSATWCGCIGVIKGETVGMVVLEHPANAGYPSVWSACPDGLISPSPFVRHAFTLAPGSVMTLQYRLLVHRGYVEHGWATARQNDYVRDVPG